jgi:tRNA threonylcarbamoyladenosine biosynthesis protein TsaE
MNVYQGRQLELRHFDLYRLNKPEELQDIGFAEYAGGDGITMIEWADMFPEEMPDAYLQITLTLIPEGRKITLLPHGKRYEELVKEAIVPC